MDVRRIQVRNLLNAGLFFSLALFRGNVNSVS